MTTDIEENFDHEQLRKGIGMLRRSQYNQNPNSTGKGTNKPHKRENELLHENGMPYTRKEYLEKVQEKLDAVTATKTAVEKVFALKEVDEIDVAERLYLAYQMLTDRLATESLLVATTSPTALDDKAEKIEFKNRIVSIREMIKIVEALKSLRGTIIEDIKTNYEGQVLSMSSEHEAALAQAKETLASVGVYDVECEPVPAKTKTRKSGDDDWLGETLNN